MCEFNVFTGKFFFIPKKTMFLKNLSTKKNLSTEKEEFSSWQFLDQASQNLIDDWDCEYNICSNDSLLESPRGVQENLLGLPLHDCDNPCCLIDDESVFGEDEEFSLDVVEMAKRNFVDLERFYQQPFCNTDTTIMDDTDLMLKVEETSENTTEMELLPEITTPESGIQSFNYGISVQNGTEEKKIMKKGKREKKKTIKSEKPTCEGSCNGDHQITCCIHGCDNEIKNRLRFSLRSSYVFRETHIKKGWNRVCHYHYFSDLYKYKKQQKAEKNAKKEE